MKTIKDLAPNPSDALQAMIDGLWEQSKRKNFVIDMSTFGSTYNSDNTCFGCAATCTIQKIAHKNLSSLEIYDRTNRAHALGFEYDDLKSFEIIINSVRCACVEDLFDWYEIEQSEQMYEFLEEYKLLLNPLDSDEWQENIFPFQMLAIQLKELGY